MSSFFGIPNLQSVTTAGGTTTQTVDFQGSVFSSGYLNISGALDVVSTGTFSADQKLQVGSPSFAEDCKRLQQAKEEIETALNLHSETKT